MSNTTSASSDALHHVTKPPSPWYRQRVPVGFCLHMFFVFVLNRFPVPVWFFCLCLVWHEVAFLLLLGYHRSASERLLLSRLVAFAGLISSCIDWYLIVWQQDVVWRFAIIRNIGIFIVMCVLRAPWKDIASVLFFMLALTASTQVFTCSPTDDFIAHISIVAASDSFQYFIGKKFGRYKPVPEISPNKTLEGYFGGLILCNFVCFLIAIDPLDPSYLLWYNGLLICGIIGDLSISTWKRFHMLKDTSNLLSSHGGVLDRSYSHIAGLLWTVIYMAVKSRPLHKGFGMVKHSRILFVTVAVWVAIWFRFIYTRLRSRLTVRANLKQS